MKNCTTCQEIKPLAEFNKHSGRKDGLQTVCRGCNRARSRKYYVEKGDEHRKAVVEYSYQRRLEVKQRLLDYLNIHPCVDCGEKDVVVLEFDHLRDKEANVARLMQGYGWNRILKEIEKCEVVCCNCHRRRTSQRNGSYRLGA